MVDCRGTQASARPLTNGQQWCMMLDLSRLTRNRKKRRRGRPHNRSGANDEAREACLTGPVGTVVASSVSYEAVDVQSLRHSDDEDERFDLDRRLGEAGFGVYQKRLVSIVGLWMYGGSSMW